MRPEILLHPNIPKPLHGMNPRTILGQEWWDQQRQIAYMQYDYHCWACDIHKSQAKYHHWLEAHECYEFDYVAGTARLIEIVALCHSCHNFIHSGKLRMDLRAGKISEAKFCDIVEHGKRIVIEHGLDLVLQNPFIVKQQDAAIPVKWSDWRLILEGKEYCSQFADFTAWQKHYTGKT